MKIVNSNGGKLCNKIWSYTFLIAHSLHYNEKIYITDFNEYIDLFDNLSSLSNIHFVKNKYERKILEFILKLVRKAKKEKVFDIKKRTDGISSVCGWNYRSETWCIEEHRESLCKLFTPRTDVVNNCNAQVSKMKLHKKVIGVHIRRTDYKHAFNGQYFLDNSVYRKYMEMITTQFTDKEVAFLICSDEKIDLVDFSGLNCFHIASAGAIEDLYALSLCDYIMGPPSTFSMWASFYGKVPLRIITEDKGDISLDQFKSILAVDTFLDGTKFLHDEKLEVL